MIRRGSVYLIAAGLMSVSVASMVSACSDSIKPPPGGNGNGTGGSTSAGGSTGTGDTGNNAGTTNNGGQSTTAAVPDNTPCDAECCPTDAKCYSSSAATKAPGAACLATRDNTGQKHVQFRQTWIRATAPVGNVGGTVYAVLSGRTELPLPTPMMGAMPTGLPDCKMNAGVLGYGGYMQLNDLYFANGYMGAPDYTNDYGMTGFAVFVSTKNVLDDVMNGFCFGTQDWTPDADNKKFELGPNDMSPQTDFNGMPWPDGLPAPLPLKDASGAEKPWHVVPAKAIRLMKDFDLSTDRKDLLTKLKSDGEYGMKGFNGVFYYDPATGVQHSYGPLSWVVVYNNDGSTHIVIPARETEIRSKVNDPAAPNCMGVYGKVTDPATGMPTVNKGNGCTNVTDGTPAWGGGDCSASTDDHHATCKPGEGPFSTKLYFLISELEQIYSADLMSTLCVSYPTAAALKPNFYNDTDHDCKGPKWNPSSADGSGLPKGDWCAATNSPATDKCHDAWRSTNFHTFAAANIKLNGNDPATCPF